MSARRINNILYFLACIIICHGQPSTFDATESYQISDDLNFRYMVTLSENIAIESSPKITFYWNNPAYLEGQKKIIKGRIVHKAYFVHEKPSWLGFGVQDISKATGFGRNIMIGADSIIGYTYDKEGNGGSNSVLQYKLNDTFEGGNGIEPIPIHESLTLNSGVTQKIDEDATIVTTFDFVRLLHNSDDDSNERAIHEIGDNLFLFAVGPAHRPSDNTIGAHVKAGSFLLDFDAVDKKLEESYESYDPACKSDYPEYEFMVTLKHKVKLYWVIVGDTVQFQISHFGNAWLSLGVAWNEEGKMIASEAVIGRPDLAMASDEKPLKYELSKYYMSGIIPMERSKQTLIDASTTQDESETIMRFTKYLDEEGQIPISKTGHTTFIYAIGHGNYLSHHRFAESFTMDLSKCPYLDNDNDNNEESKNDQFRSAWIAHGVFGSLAFVLLFPLSAASAILRKLMPSTWIFFHTFGNIAAFASTLFAVFVAITTTSNSGGEHFVEKHHKIGISLLLLSFCQVIGGLFRPGKSQNDDNNNSKLNTRHIWKLGHGLLGTSILILGYIQVGDGLNMFAEDYSSVNLTQGYITLIIVGCIVLLGARIWLFVFSSDDVITFSGLSSADISDELFPDQQFHVEEDDLTYPETELTIT